MSHVPGLKVFSVYDCEDARGMLKASVRDDNPVVLLENEMMYGVPFKLSDEAMDKDFLIPFGKIKIMKEGTDVTITGYAKMVGHALKAAEIL